jgi:hypothetical protein
MLPDPKATTSAVYVYTGVLDMRVGFDRLAARIQEEYHCSAQRTICRLRLRQTSRKNPQCISKDTLPVCPLVFLVSPSISSSPYEAIFEMGSRRKSHSARPSITPATHSR